MYGRCPKDVAKMLKEEKWLRYDEPSLRWNGNKDLAENDIVVYSEDELWEVLRAKDKFPQGVPELAATKLPSNDFIQYLLKTKTVFRQTVVLTSGEKVLAIFMSDTLSKDEILEAIRKEKENE